MPAILLGGKAEPHLLFHAKSPRPAYRGRHISSSIAGGIPPLWALVAKGQPVGSTVSQARSSLWGMYNDLIPSDPRHPMPSEKTKYPQLIKFARANPLPTDAPGLSLGILDVASLLVACLHREAASWDSMSLSLMHEARASAYPGSRLSNPAMLLNTRTSGPFGPSQGGHGPGCFFSYSHYQENSLGPALLLAAFSPRTMRPAISAAGYAQAIALLLSGGFLASARMSSGSSELSLDDFVNEAPCSENVPRASMSLEFHRAHIARLDRLRTDIGMKAALLALSDDKANLFGNDVREKLLALATRRSAESEASLIEASLSGPLLRPKFPPPRI